MKRLGLAVICFLAIVSHLPGQWGESRELLGVDFNIDCHAVDVDRFYLNLEALRLGDLQLKDNGDCSIWDSPSSYMRIMYWVGDIEITHIEHLVFGNHLEKQLEFDSDCLLPDVTDKCLAYTTKNDSAVFLHNDKDPRVDLISQEIRHNEFVNLNIDLPWTHVDTFRLRRVAIESFNKTADMSYLLTTQQYPIGEYSTISLNKYDAEGDSLSYRFSTSSGLPSSALFDFLNLMETLHVFPYSSGYSALEPLGPNGMIIDNENHELILNPSTKGKFFIHMTVDEYRNGILLCAKPFFFPIWIIDNIPKVEASVQADDYQEELAIINLCEFSEYTFLNNSSVQNDIDFFYWVINGDTLTDWSPTYAFDSPGIFDAELFIEDVEGCSDAQLITINVGEPITASYSAAPATAIYAGEALQFTNTSTGSFNHSHWQISNGQSFTSENLTHTFSEPGIFEISLTIENELGCQKTYAQSFEFKTPDGFYFPNVFSPNEDGANDEFRPYGNFDFIKDYEMKIFDRWGALLFQSNDPLLGWNGNSRDSKKALSGIYVFQIQYLDANDKLQTKVGDILLL